MSRLSAFRVARKWMTMLTAGTLCLGVGVCSVLPAVVDASVSKTPAWKLQALTLPSSFSTEDSAPCESDSGDPNSGVCDRFMILPTNTGGRASEGPVTIVDILPEGLTTSETPHGTAEIENEEMSWECSTETPASREIVRCTSSSGVPPLTPAAPVIIPVIVSTGLVGPLTNEATISGGEASSSVSISSVAQVDAPAPPSFGPLAFSTSAVDFSGAQEIEAASHPGGLTTEMAFPTAMSSRLGNTFLPFAVEDVKQIVTDLPPGLVGNPQAATTCSLVDVANLKENQKQCPASSRVGKLELSEAGGVNSELTIFNVDPEHGYAAEFAVFLPELERATLLYGKLVGSGATAHVRVVSAPQDSLVSTVGISLTFFGTPAELDGKATPATAFFTNPSDCAATSFSSTVYVDTWQHPGAFEADGEPDLGDANWKRATSESPPVRGCGSVLFQPTFSFGPEAAHAMADEPAGYTSELTFGQGVATANGLATSPVRNTVVTLPAGVAISPAAAVGLTGCALGGDGIGLEHESEADQPGHCPASSKVGEAEATTPVLSEPLTGGVYVAEPTCGGAAQPACTEAAAEAGEVFALYMELGSDNAGVHVKLRGKIEVGGNGGHNGLDLGQIRATFGETPQQPVSKLRLSFRGGPQAPLANPVTCGSLPVTASLEPWSHQPAPSEPSGTPNALITHAFSINGCTNGFSPGFDAGSVSSRPMHTPHSH